LKFGINFVYFAWTKVNEMKARINFMLKKLLFPKNRQNWGNIKKKFAICDKFLQNLTIHFGLFWSFYSNKQNFRVLNEILSNFARFRDFKVSILQLYITFALLSNFFKICEFQTQNLKSKLQGKKVNIAISYWWIRIGPSQVDLYFCH
jgi:hypothetical protein